MWVRNLLQSDKFCFRLLIIWEVNKERTILIKHQSNKSTSSKNNQITSNQPKNILIKDKIKYNHQPMISDKFRSLNPRLEIYN